ncbi:fused MFS/spermidine synthase [Catellatospora bangladeshensis]|uniref:fused MFS/spermidine synthase n=1 Tax=Catellatospora bangladeshensis TaxID=310355 RepID=UPI0036069817
MGRPYHRDGDGSSSCCGRLPDRLALVLTFAASGAVLVLETVSLRLVAPYLGLSLQVTSAVIGMSLGAIAYGAWLGGWHADRRDPRRLLAPLLTAAGLATAVTLPLIRWLGEALRGTSVSMIMALTALTVFVPIMLLSAVPPMVVKLQLGDLDRTGRVVGRLSGVGTLGAVTATLVTGFVLVAALPTSAIMIGLAVLLGLSGLALHGYLRREDRPRTTTATSRMLAVALLAAGAGLSITAPDPCDVETAYHCAKVTTDPRRPTGRVLHLNAAEHSYVDLADPTRLEYGYIQWFGAAADVVAAPGAAVDAVHLGGGGFTMPRYLAATRPGSRSTVFEIDGGLVDLAQRELGLRTGPALRAVVGDGRLLLAGQADKSADLIVGDAFGDLAVPWHLTTREMMAQVRRVTRDGGIYVQNVIDGPPLRFIRAELATVASVFPHVALVAPEAAVAGRAGDNFVIVASARPLPLQAMGARLLLLPEAPELLHGDRLREFIGDAAVLTDDYAPVDQMLVRVS